MTVKNEKEKRGRRHEGRQDEKTDMKRKNGWANEWKELCRSKWLGLIRHETLHTGGKEAVGQQANENSHLNIQSSIQAAMKAYNQFTFKSYIT